MGAGFNRERGGQFRSAVVREEIVFIFANLLPIALRALSWLSVRPSAGGLIWLPFKEVARPPPRFASCYSGCGCRGSIATLSGASCNT